MLDFLATQFEMVNRIGPNLRELSIEGNPIVEKTLQEEFESRDGYLESPGNDLDHF